MNKVISFFLVVGVFCISLSIKIFSELSCPDEHEEIFTCIYDTAVWGYNNQGQASSGGGSTLHSTKKYRTYLTEFMKKKDIKSVVDVGCGDWEFSQHIDWGGIYYTGYDVVAHVIKRNEQFFASENIKFIHGNFLLIDLPQADLLLCKHVLQHWRNQDILKFIKQLKRFKYCLITNEVDPKTMSSSHPDTHIGGGQKIDLSKPPFNIEGEKVLSYKIGTSVHQVFLVDNTQ